MTTVTESILRKEDELLASRKRKRELSEAIKAKGKELNKADVGSTQEGAGSDTVAALLEQFGASSFESSPACIPPRLATYTSSLSMLFELSGFCTDVVVSWAMGQGLRRTHATPQEELWDAELRSKIAAGVEWLYILSPVDQDNHPKKTLRLSRYVIEYRLFHWLVSKNCDSGVNPGNSQLVVEAVRCAPASLPVDLKEQLCVFFTRNDRATRYWIQSFCGRWGVGMGRRLRPGENMLPEVMDQKASQHR